MILDATDESIVAVMSGAPATTNPDFATSYSDYTSSAFTPGGGEGSFNGTTEITLISAPMSSTMRLPAHIAIRNRDTASITITISKKKGATNYQIGKFTLVVDDNLEWDRDIGWKVTDINGTTRAGSGHDPVTLASDADILLGLSAQQLNFDNQTANLIFAGPVSGGAADPTFRAQVVADLPALNGFTDKAQIASDDRIPIYSTVDSANRDVPAFFSYGICNGRLSVVSGNPTPGDTTGAGTIYFVPYRGSQIALYDGTRWKLYTFTQLSLALSTTAGTNYDVYVYDNSGTLTLELTGWTDNTTRATAIALQDGVYVKSGTPTRRLLGTIRGIANNTADDTNGFRYVSNVYNRILKRQFVGEATNSWNYTTDAWQEINAGAGGYTVSRFGLLRTLDDDALWAQHIHLASNNLGICRVSAGIGISSATVNSAQIIGQQIYLNQIGQIMGLYLAHPGVGQYDIVALERSQATGTTTWYGDNGLPNNMQSGLQAMGWY